MKTTLIIILLIGGVFSISLCGTGSDVTISEVAWAGSADDPTAEWIELHNTTTAVIDLSGWRLISSDGAPEIALTGKIPPHEYRVLHRSDAGPERSDDRITYSGALRDGGESLYLLNSAGVEADSANSQGGAWPAGKAGDVPCTMERIDQSGPDRPENWATAQDLADDGLFYGTPGARNSVSYTPPQGTFTFDPNPAHPGEPVLFSGQASLDTRIKVASYAWDFGDDSIGRGQTFSHTYVQTGSYSVLLTLRDDRGGVANVVKDVRVIVNALPRIDFSVRSEVGKRILQSLDPILFSDESYDPDGEVVSWMWSFGDGATSTQPSPSHTYIGCGTYIVGLDVTDNNEEHSYQTRSLRIESIAPVAAYTFSPRHPNVGSPVILDASGSFDRDGSITSYAWDIDNDGSVDHSSTLPSASFSFPRGGTHSVALQVTDDCGVISLPYVKQLVVNYPPKAAFQVSNFYPKQAEIVRFIDQSHDDDGTIASWKWDFGDGTSSTEESPQHAYGGTGAYLVALTVTDEDGSQATVSSQVTVANIPPTAHITANGQEGKTEVKTGEAVMFDGSHSHDDKNPPREGKIVSYHWDLDGDGTFEKETFSPTVAHSYADNGSYKVRLQVTDDSGATALSNQVTIVVHNQPPSASFTFSPSGPSDADEVSFTDDSTDADGTILSWQWSFGDGALSTAKNPHHVFADDGTYEIALIVTDNDGATSAACARTITVVNAIPVAQFELPVGASAGDPVTFVDHSFDRSPSGEIVHVAWDFGDGTVCPGSVNGCDGGTAHSPVHNYDSAGIYTVSLVVIDDDGALATISRILSVTSE